MDLPFLIYPLAMGFALVAPFAAAAFYAVSDLRERGEPVTRSAVLAGRGEDHDPGQPEAHQLGGRQGGEQAEELPEEDAALLPARHGFKAL